MTKRKRANLNATGTTCARAKRKKEEQKIELLQRLFVLTGARVYALAQTAREKRVDCFVGVESLGIEISSLDFSEIPPWVDFTEGENRGMALLREQRSPRKGEKRQSSST